jgi:phospholipid/cholesterol/gamma-HCH transport system ATP-binding protein
MTRRIEPISAGPDPSDAVDVARLEHVYKAFGDNVVFEDLNLAVRRGEVLALLGASGSGKSVLLKMLIGLVPHDAGRVLLFGQDITGYDDRALLPLRRRIAMVFQNAALFDSLSVFDNLAYALRERGDMDEDEIGERVIGALRTVDLAGKERLLPGQLSGGMRKRVGIARAVVQAPEILLYDDPTAGLDPVNVRRIDELILRLREELGLTSVVVTHDLASAFMLSDRLALIARRRIVEEAPSEIFRASRTPEVRAFLDAMPIVGGHGRRARERMSAA